MVLISGVLKSTYAEWHIGRDLKSAGLTTIVRITKALNYRLSQWIDYHPKWLCRKL